MEQQILKRDFKFNKNKMIGNVIFVVEGNKDEFNLLKCIFHHLLGYSYIKKSRINKTFCEFKNEKSKSTIYVINSKNSNICSIVDDEIFTETLFRDMTEKYGLDVTNTRKYYIFDRDSESNKNHKYKEALEKFNDPYTNSNNENLGLLLTSYPNMEAYLISMREENPYSNFSYDKVTKTKKDKSGLKKYCKKNLYKCSKIKEFNLLKAFDNLLDAIEIIDDKLVIDDFPNLIKCVFEKEEKIFATEKEYRILSLLSIVLYDLGIIDIELE